MKHVEQPDVLDQPVNVVYGDSSGEDTGEVCSLRSVYDGLAGDCESRLGILDFAARVSGDTLTIPSICGTYLRIERAA